MFWMRYKSTVGRRPSVYKNVQSFKRCGKSSNIQTQDGCIHIVFVWISLKILLYWQMNSSSARFSVICFPMPLSMHLRILRCLSVPDYMTKPPGQVIPHLRYV